MNILFIDTETSGLPEKNATIFDHSKWPFIIQISFILYNEVSNDIIYTFNRYIKINDDVNISEESLSVHGITREYLNENGISITEALTTLYNAFKHADIIVAHNLRFDKNVIMVEFGRNNMKHNLYKSKNYVCTMKETKELCKIPLPSNNEKLKCPKLIELYNHCFPGEPLPENMHNSMIDIIICMRCYYKYKKNIDIFTKNETLYNLYIENGMTN